MELSAEKLIKNYEQLKSDRMDFDSKLQKLHDMFYVESADFTTEKSRGQQTHDLLDSTSLDCSDVAAAGLANFLTPESSKWFFLEHADRTLREDDDVKRWLDEVQEEVMLTLARSNFYNQMPIFYKSSVVYGTSALFCEADEDDGVRFYNIPLNQLYITEDARERPSEFYLVMKYTAEQALSRFGDKCSDKIKDCYKNGRQENKKFEFLCYFGKRKEYDKTKQDKANMPIRMVWVDVKEKTIVAEDGFLTMPCVAHRFYKKPQDVYGDSPAMKALPYARTINTITDTMLRGFMKATDPAIALPDDAFLGRPNFNPRQLNYYQRGRLSPKEDIIPIGAYGNPQLSVEPLQYYQNQIREMMFYNTFQYFNNLTKQMTVPEVMERVSEKMTILGPAVGRFMNDVLQPLIEKVVLILWEGGRLPPMPDAMMNDPSFEVKFVGRLVQSQRQSEINNIVNALSIAGQIAQFNPEVLDKVDTDKALEEVFEINGVPARVMRDDMEVEQIRKSRAEMQQQQMQMAQAQQMADVYKTATDGGKNEAAIQTDRQ